MLDIYIPGYKRPDAPVVRKLAEARIPFTIVLDHEKDIESYRKWTKNGARIMFIDKALGIGHVRQKIKELYSGVPIVMIDDDTQFGLRKFEDPTRLSSCKTSEDVKKWFHIVDEFCRKNCFDIGSVSDSVWKWSCDDKIIRSGSLCSVTIFNSKRCHEIDYDPHLYKRMEDWDLIMQAITKHFDFLICNEVVRHCPMNKEAKSIGGCSEVYQDFASMESTSKYLLNKWGDKYVKFSKSKKIGEYPDFSVDLKKMRGDYGYEY